MSRGSRRREKEREREREHRGIKTERDIDKGECVLVCERVREKERAVRERK